MSNNLRNIEKNLRAFAKRSKSIKFSSEMLLAFLISGVSGFAAKKTVSSDSSSEGTKKQLVSSIGDMKKLFKEARQENNKLLRNSNLELIQLMEQGDHVVKSPWSSWQFGANFYYDNWHGAFKGKGDKIYENQVYLRQSQNFSDSLLRYVTDNKNLNSYNLTELNIVPEYPVTVSISAGIRPKSVNKAETTFVPLAPSGSLPPFEPRMVGTPSKPNSPTLTPPSFFTPPTITANGQSFSQRATIGHRDKDEFLNQISPSYPNQSVTQNYDSYSNTGTTTVNFNDNSTSWSGGSLQMKTDQNVRTVYGNLNTTITNTAGNSKVVNWTADPYILRNAGIYTLKDGTVIDTQITRTSGEGGADNVLAFISDTRDHDTNISGNYVMNNNVMSGGTSKTQTKLFYSLNPAGVGGKPIWGWSDGTGVEQHRTATFTSGSTLTLNGTSTEVGSTLVGMEMQLYNKDVNSTRSADESEWKIASSTSTLKNEGTIDLASGYNLVGIMVDVETSNDMAKVQDKVINDGKININSKKSVGIDFGKYQNGFLKADISLGEINVNGSENYGFRMANIMNSQNTSTGPTNGGSSVAWATFEPGDYYNYATIDGSGKTITVSGSQNVGVSISKGMSQTSTSKGNNNAVNVNNGSTTLYGTTNPIANIKHLNILVKGTDSVGFLRNADSDANNTADIILDNDANKSSSNGGTIESLNFGAGATNSTLVRSDKYGIVINTDIDSTQGSTGNSFAQSSNGGYVINKGALSSSLDEFTGMVSSGANGTTKSKVSNEGTITLTSNSDNLVGLAALNNADIANTGTIKVSGTGKNKAGIYNNGTGTATLGNGSKIEISGDSSSAVYNNGGTVNFSGTANSITANNGAVGVFSSGGTVTSTSGNNLTINVNDTTKKGLGVYAENAANVNLGSAKINVQGGAAGVVSDGAGTNLNLQGATLTYNGDGYAIYANNGGFIDLSNNATINLYGKATGFEKNTSTVNLTGSTIHIYSDDVTVVNVKDGGTLNTVGLQSNVNTMAGAGSLSINSSHGFTNYKLAAIDGLTAYNVYNIDKSIATDPSQSNNDSYVFTKNLLVQRAITNLKAGNSVKAVLSGSDLTQIGASSVVGLDISSSKNAASNNETQINMEANTAVTADRSDAGSGAVGLYINYGKINTDPTATINVEKEANTVNDSAVGIYSVNGSEVNNAGTVNVGGNSSVGILGMGYREDTSGAVVGAEFGTGAAGQGKATVTNSGSINLDGENASGIYMKNNSGAATSDISGTNTGTITMSGNSAVGMIGTGAALTNSGTINITGQKAVGMFGNSNSVLSNTGTINIADSANTNSINIGMFTNDIGTTISNDGTLNVDKNSYGIYGKNVTTGINSKINVGDNGVGLFSNGNSVTVNGELNINPNEAVGVFTSGNGSMNITNNASILTIGDNSYGFVLRSGATPERIQANGGTTGLGATTFVSNTPNVTLGNDAVYVYSADSLGTVTNNTAITTTGSNNYGLYSAGNVINNASGNMNLTSGVGNVGIYSIENGNAKNYATIDVGSSDRDNKYYSIGMAAGYYNENTRRIEQTGTVENHGTINVNNDYGIGMYAVGNGSKAVNYGTINIDGKGTTGMYLDQNATGINYGTIQTSATPSNNGIIGVAALNNSLIKNYGRIIVTGNGNIGVYTAGNGTYFQETGANPAQGGAVTTGSITAADGATDRKNEAQVATDKTVGGINIIAPAGASVATIERNGVQVPIDSIDTVSPIPQPQYVTVNNTSLIDLNNLNNGTANVNLAKASSLGMYVDTSGVNYTNPIEGIQNLNLSNVNLILGSEASKYTLSRDIEVGDNILKPFNDVLAPLAQNGLTMSYISGALNWIATATYKTDGTLSKVYMSKIPYTAYTKTGDTDNYNFLDGLEQRYGVDGINTREKALFDKLNAIGKGESRIFVQAVDEMKGYQYSNTQQRIVSTGRILEKEFDYLKDEWDTKSKQSNKIKAFGSRNEYNTDTAGIINNTSNGYGVAYLHEDETVKMGDTSGWYAGAVYNQFKFKDIGGSKENQIMLKSGIFKSIPFDHNNSLNWTISAEGFISRNEMNRKFLVLDEIFNANSHYYAYGAAVKNEISKAFRTSERTSITPYGSLKLEYGRLSKISEKNGQVRLEVKENDYYSVRPEVGIQFKYKQPMAVRTTFTTSLNLAYENELGKINDVNNRARVNYTTADWYNLRNEKEDRKGNFKADLNFGIENQRFGVTLNAGYDTKGENMRGGIGFRAIY